MKGYLIIAIFAFLGFWNRGASAWGGPPTDSAAGLNLGAGFDVNTITAITGAVVTPPGRAGETQHTTMTVAATQGTVTVVLGPWWYWEKQNIAFSQNQEITVTGSLAQGKDGGLYLFAQRLEKRNTGETVTLRSDTGVPAWSRNGAGNQNGMRGPGYRGGGMRGGRR